MQRPSVSVHLRLAAFSPSEPMLPPSTAAKGVIAVSSWGAEGNLSTDYTVDIAAGAALGLANNMPPPGAEDARPVPVTPPPSLGMPSKSAPRAWAASLTTPRLRAARRLARVRCSRACHARAFTALCSFWMRRDFKFAAHSTRLNIRLSIR